MPPSNVTSGMPTRASLEETWMRHATYSGQDIIHKVVPVTLTVRDVEYRTIRHHLNPAAPAYTVEQIEKLLDTIRPGEWVIRMFGECDTNAPDEAFNLDTIFIGDGDLLAIASAVGGPWGGGVSLVNAKAFTPWDDQGETEEQAVTSILRATYQAVDTTSHLLGYA